MPQTEARRVIGATTTGLDAVVDRLHALGIAHDPHGNHIRAECPVCHNTGRRKRRRPLVITQQPGRLAAYAHCGCRIADIARALGLPPTTLLTFKVRLAPSSLRSAGSNTDQRDPLSTRNANRWGVTLALDNLKRGPGQRNLNGVRRIAEDLDKQSTRLAPGEWLSYDSRRAAEELGCQRRTVQRNLDWLVGHGILEERQPPAPGEMIVTEHGRETAKSGVKQYRLLNERRQIERLARRT